MTIPKSPKHNRIRPGRYVNKAHLAFVSKKACCVCGAYPCQPHHPITTDSRRQYGKCHDWECVPLCFEHHQELHDKIGNEHKFQEIYSVNFHEVARLLVLDDDIIDQRIEE